jgi:PAS domain S-box-containing protein
MNKEVAIWQRKWEREKNARTQAEAILEDKAFELFEASELLKKNNEDLEHTVEQRTKALKESQRRLETFISNLQYGILLEDENRRMMLTNKAFCSIFSIPVAPEALIGADCEAAVHEIKNLFVDADYFVSRINQLLDKRALVLGDELHTTDGRILERNYVPIFFDDDYIGHCWQYRDVTQLRLAQEQIKLSEEKYRGVIENMELGILEVDNNGLIVRAYQRFCEMTGYNEAEIVGKNAADLFLTEQSKKTLEEQTTTRNKGNASNYEVQMLRKDGSLIWVVISGAPIFNTNKEIIGSMGIHLNITQRKQMETELKEAKIIAENAQYAEKEFLANMSHEIRTPLNAIIGMAHLLYDTRPTKQQREYLDVLKNASNILHGLISDILDIAKIEAGKIEIQNKPFDLIGLVRTLQKTFQMRANEKELQVEAMIDARIDGLVIGDELLLNQILLNLLGNSLKFTETGHIGISTRLLKRQEGKVAIEFKVYDSGIGISSEKLPMIFQKFKQVDNNRQQQHRGTGLGLAIVKELIELQGGTIKAQSELGEGTSITFTLSYADGGNIELQTATNIPESVINHVPLNQLNVLVVEDNEMNQRYVLGLLQKWKIPFDIAANGSEALALVQKKAYNLILMDLEMPIMDGYNATIAIRNTHNHNQRTPIVALTASALIDQKHKALGVGMNDFLTKPFAPTQLKQLLIKYAPSAIDNLNGEVEHTFKFNEQLDSSFLDIFYEDDMNHAHEMFDTFLNDVLPDFPMLQNLFDAEKWEDVQKLSHKLKPTVAMVGLTWLEPLLLLIEQATRKHPVDNLHNIAQAIEKVNHDLQTYTPILQTEWQRLKDFCVIAT